MNKSIASLCAMLAAAFGLMSSLPVSAADAANKSVMQQEKSEVAPHTVMIESALMSALDQIKGIRLQLDIGSTEAINHMKLHSKEINDDLKTTLAHQKELQGAVKIFPELANSKDYKVANTALSDVEGVNKAWQIKTTQSDYWNNQDQVRADLDMFEGRLNSALDRTKSFNSNKLNAPNIG